MMPHQIPRTSIFEDLPIIFKKWLAISDDTSEWGSRKYSPISPFELLKVDSAEITSMRVKDFKKSTRDMQGHTAQSEVSEESPQ
jgi:hypothetical protein